MTSRMLRKKLTYSTKLKIVEAIDNGVKKCAVAQNYGVNESTIRSIYKNKEKIKKFACTAPDESAIFHSFRVNNTALIAMERVLARYVQNENKRGSHVVGSRIRRKAAELYKKMAEKNRVGEPPAFQASKGWYYRFLRRHQLNNSVVSEEAASEDLLVDKVHRTERHFLEDLPGNKTTFPVPERLPLEPAEQQVVMSAHDIVGSTDVDKEAINERIVCQEEDTEEMLEGIDEEEEQQQQPAEEEESPGEPNTSSLRTALEMFDKFTHYLYNMDPYKSRAYAVCEALREDMSVYRDMLSETMNVGSQSNVTDLVATDRQQEENGVQSDDNLHHVLSLFPAFQDDDQEDSEASTTSSSQPSTSATEPSSTQ